MLITNPAVFAVGDVYHIMVPVSEPSLMWVEIGDQKFCDESNGIMCSNNRVHRMVVPMEVLDRCGSYTICDEVLIARKPYFSTTRPVERYVYEFRPVVEGKTLRAYHIADAHNRVEGPVAAAKNFGPMDFLIMNGDIPDHSGDVKNFDDIYRIISQVTGGEIPVVFARGNHDMRGNCAEEFAKYTPNQNGNTYYTFRLGPVWGVILDSGEDKEDGHPAYGHTICCTQFRRRQIGFLEEICRHADREFAAPGVRYKLVVTHNPFTYQQGGDFDIDEDIFRSWARILADGVKPDLMICGHIHECRICPVGSPEDHLGQPCTVVWGSEPQEDGPDFTGCGYIFDDQGMAVEFTNAANTIHDLHRL